ncbi:MAG: hypothetical protein HYT80_09040 [Euryarchaeota archaeon]|nr:hypothetical protein [Euryarchaeota archaeon]
MTATVYSVVGWQLDHRTASSPAAHRALRFFVLWWYATALNIYLGGLFYMAAAFGMFHFETQYAYAVLQRLLLATSLWGLLTYLVFLVKGRFWPATIGALYLAYGLFMVGTIVAGRPDGLYVGQWRTDLSYAAESPAWTRLLVFVGIVLPPILLSTAYLVAIMRLPRSERGQRYRAILVSSSLIVWWVVAVIAGQRMAFEQEWFQLVNRMVGLAASLIILIAYRPPSWIRRAMSMEARPAAAA